MFLLITTENYIVNASSNEDKISKIDNYRNVDELGYLYNFDDSSDYIYIDFIDNTGYIIF